MARPSPLRPAGVVALAAVLLAACASDGAESRAPVTSTTMAPGVAGEDRLPPIEREALVALAEDSRGRSLEPHGDGGGHSHAADHGGDPPAREVPLDATDAARLAEEWEQAVAAAVRLADADGARAAGYVPAAPQIAGIGTHWVRWSLVRQPFDPARPAMLLFDHRSGAPRLAGFSYWVHAPLAPEGFAGPNDRWHQHRGMCFEGAWLVREDIPADRCHGRWLHGDDLWMLHAWVVPGKPNRWGRFAPTNPDLCPAHDEVPDIASCDPMTH